MAPVSAFYEELSGLFAYPEPDYRDRARRCVQLLAVEHPEFGADAGRFAEGIEARDDARVEELYTTTFDLNPACCPEIGWHLFGERYDRGSFMVWMRKELRRVGIEETGELPDHLTHALALLGRMEAEQAARFATEAVGPAVDKMIASLADPENPYAGLLRLTQQVLTADFGPPRWKSDHGAWNLQADPLPLSKDEE